MNLNDYCYEFCVITPNNFDQIMEIVGMTGELSLADYAGKLFQRDMTNTEERQLEPSPAEITPDMEVLEVLGYPSRVYTTPVAEYIETYRM